MCNYQTHYSIFDVQFAKAYSKIISHYKTFFIYFIKSSLMEIASYMQNRF